MKTYVFLSEKSWHRPLFENLKGFWGKHKWVFIENQRSFSLNALNKINPEKIFIPHWSYIIPEDIYNNFECIVFHMTDLPFGRGGSPLQNLIIRGFKETKISAIRVSKGLDEGDLYLKKELSLDGSAQEIFIRSTDVIFEMIKEIIEKNLIPVPQMGEPTLFKRRKPKEGNLKDLKSISQMYDYIRMLDADGYPNAFLETKEFKIEFSNATLKSNNQILANVRITKK